MKRKIVWIDKRCKTCDIEYKTTYMNKSGLCKKCRMREHNKKNLLSEDEFKKPYPLESSEKIKRYRRIKRALNKAGSREEQKALIAKEFDYIVESGIWLWCIDRRTEGVEVKREIGKRGRKKLVDTDSKLKYPSTKEMME